MQHVYETTRDVTERIGWQHLDGTPVGQTTEFVKRAGRYIYRGGKRAFAALLAKLNAEHGEGYAILPTDEL